MEGVCVRKITFDRDMTDNDFRDMREYFGDKLVHEDTREIIVAFDSAMDCIAFMVATGYTNMTEVMTEVGE